MRTHCIATDIEDLQSIIASEQAAQERHIRSLERADAKVPCYVMSTYVHTHLEKFSHLARKGRLCAYAGGPPPASSSCVVLRGRHPR